MKHGYLSQYFNGVAVKQLSSVEVDILTSHQHEFNGVGGLRKMLGTPSGRVEYPATFMYMTDYDDAPLVESGTLTWYDARQRAREERGINRTEYRLYFPENRVLQSASVGDILIIAKLHDDSLLSIISEAGTTITQQLMWLFGVDVLTHPGFSVREELETDRDRIAFTSRFILESIGVQVNTSEDTYLDDMLRRFPNGLPSTSEFSSYARETVNDINPQENVDACIMAWMEREEILFRTFEKHLLGERLQNGFADVSDFMRFSLSVQNRRKSRAGYAFENHLECVFTAFGIRFSRSALTENRSRPDFLFPSEVEYHDRTFVETRLTMLGVKTSCKDRWRQVLSEANRIRRKHLITLEAAISMNQTNEMKANDLQLIVPKTLHHTFSSDQQVWLMDVSAFVCLVKERQIGQTVV